jgi:hypothetical protein
MYTEARMARLFNLAHNTPDWLELSVVVMFRQGLPQNKSHASPEIETMTRLVRLVGMPAVPS